MTNLHLYIAIAVLFILDTVITVYALRAFPRQLGEANPVMARLIKVLGPEGALLATKVLAFVLAYWAQPALVVLQIVAVFYAGVVIWNLAKVRKARASLKASP